MNSFPSWLSGDPTLIWGLSLLLQVTVITTVALIVARCARRIPVLRYWILCSSLFLVLLTPCLTLVMQLSGISFLTLSVTQDSPAAAADLTESRNPVVAMFPSSSRENFGDDPERVPTVVESTSDTLAWEPSEEYRHARSYEDLESSGANASDASDSVGTLHTEVAASATRVASARTESPRIGDLPRMVLRPLMFIWFTGTLFLLARLIVNWCRLAVMLRSAKSVASVPVALLLEEVARESGVRQVPEIVFSARVSSPISAGLIRPRVILPERLVDRVNREQLRDILLHELAHIERRDQAIVLTQHLSVALFWLHPLVNILNRELAKAREEVCDNFVLAATDGPSYSRTLFALTELVQATRPLPGAVGLFTAHWKLEHRIAGLLDDRRNRMTRLTARGKTTICLLSLGVAALAAMGTLTPAASQGEQAELAGSNVTGIRLFCTRSARIGSWVPSSRSRRRRTRLKCNYSQLDRRQGDFSRPTRPARLVDGGSNT